MITKQKTVNFQCKDVRYYDAWERYSNKMRKRIRAELEDYLAAHNVPGRVILTYDTLNGCVNMEFHDIPVQHRAPIQLIGSATMGRFMPFFDLILRERGYV